ncbi:MAG: hypothetical protein IJW77_04645 [Clostridia bacterium]|nr:hypothetical protein [Clostridia bacterium]
MKTMTISDLLTLTPENIPSDTVFIGDKAEYEITEKDIKWLCAPIYTSFCDRGVYPFPVAVVLNNVRNVTLDFGGATLLLWGQYQPFLIENCENVTIKNVTVVYARSPYTELRILKNENNCLYLQPLEKFPCCVEDGYLIPYGHTWENRELHLGNMFIQAFDTESGEGRGLAVCQIGEQIEQGKTPPAFVRHYKVREENGAIVLMGEIPPEWDETMTIVLAHAKRDISSAFLICTTNTILENYRILNGQGMGILGMYSENITLDGLCLTRDEKSHGIVTNGADAVHLVASKGQINVRNCLIEGMTDDALNVHTVFLEVSECRESCVKLLCHPERHMIRANYKLIGVGDTLQFYRGNTMETGECAVVQNITVLDDDHLELTLDRTLTLQPGDYVENLSTQPDLFIENSRFAKANSHLRLQTRGKVTMCGCEIHLPLMLTGDTNYWQEASPIRDMTVENCAFCGERGFIRSCPEFTAVDAAPYYHQNIVIRNNTFDQKTALEANGTDNILFVNNTHAGNNAPLILRLHGCGIAETDASGIIERN